jgi:hypothetical protein
VPSAWLTGYKAFQIFTTSLFGTSSRDANLGANVFVNSSGNYAYTESSQATLYTQYLGVHSWYNAPSGTAGNTISFTQAMTLDASGRLGIGTTSISTYGGWGGLDVRGANGGHIIVGNSALTNRGEIFTDSNGFNVNATTNNALLFKTNDTERLRISSTGAATFSGNLFMSAPAGVGTYISFKNDNNTSGFDIGQLNGSGADSYIYQRANASLILGTNNTERLRITSGGNVGIGTSSPTRLVDVQAANVEQGVSVTSTTGTNAAFYGANNGAGSFYFGLDNSAGTSFGTAYTGAIYRSGAYPITFYTNAVERMRIKSDGKINFSSLPTSATGLSSGDIWNDGGTLKIV